MFGYCFLSNGEIRIPVVDQYEAVFEKQGSVIVSYVKCKE